MSEDYEEFFNQHLEDPTEHGDEIRAKCPFHDDQKPSFSANIDTGLWNCQSGCGGGEPSNLTIDYNPDDSDFAIITGKFKGKTLECARYGQGMSCNWEKYNNE